MSDVLRQEIINLGIGNKIRLLRKQRGMTLARLGELSGLSIGFLSQVENDQVVPPLTTLLAIALALEVKLEDFFRKNEPKERIVHTKKEDQVTVPRRRTEEVGYLYKALSPRRAEKKFEPFLVEFGPKRLEEMKYFEHPGEEFIYVLDGLIEFRSGDKVFVLEPGDSLYFDSDMPHGARGLEQGSSRAVIVVTSD